MCTRRRSRQAPPSPTRVTPRCFTHSIRAECRQRADTGGEEGGRHPVSPSSGERVGTGPPPGVRCGRGSPHAFGRSTSRIARRGVPRAHRISPTEIAPRFECRRARSCEVTRPPQPLPALHSTSALQHGQKVERANLRARKRGLAKEGPGSQSNAPKEGAPKEEEAGGDN